jgi:hypothetical protein
MSPELDHRFKARSGAAIAIRYRHALFIRLSCPAPDGDGDQSVIGFDITFDVHTGAILNVKPGLDCVVC